MVFGRNRGREIVLVVRSHWSIVVFVIDMGGLVKIP